MRHAHDVEVTLGMDSIDWEDQTFCFRMNVFVADLKADLKAHGQDFPVVVREKGEGYQLVCGFRRVTALKELKRREVRAVVRELTDDEAWRLAWSENEERSSYTPVDRAHAVARARLAGLSLRRMERNFGLKKSALAELRVLADSPDEVQARVVAGDLTTKHAVAMNVLKGKFPDFEYARWLATTVEEGLSVGELKRRVSVAYDAPRRPVVAKPVDGKYRLRAVVLEPAAMSAGERAAVLAELMMCVRALRAVGG